MIANVAPLWSTVVVDVVVVELDAAAYASFLD